MKALQSLRQVVEYIGEEVQRHQAQRGASQGGARDGYEFDIREGDVVVEPEPRERDAIEMTDAALSYRESHASYRRAGLARRLRDKEAIRDAIVVNEILQRPVALRRRT